MAYRYRAKKKEVDETHPVICHNISQDMFSLAVHPSWFNNSHINCVSIDPGIVNLCYRIEKRPVDGEVMEVETLYHSNTNLDIHKADSATGISNLYDQMNGCLNQNSEIYDDVHLVVIEKQLTENQPAVRVSQHLITFFTITMKNSTRQPMILEVIPQLKTNMLGPYFIKNKKICNVKFNPKEVKTWAIEKALQLSFIRQDWVSFDNIINASVGKSKKKSDDLSDTIVQLEAVCKHFGLATTPVPDGWDEICSTRKWSTGLIFFEYLLEGLEINNVSADTILGWLTIIKKYRTRIIMYRSNQVLIDGEFKHKNTIKPVAKVKPLKVAPKMTLKPRIITATTTVNVKPKMVLKMRPSTAAASSSSQI